MMYFWDELSEYTDGSQRKLPLKFLARHDNKIVLIEIVKRVVLSKCGDILRSELVSTNVSYAVDGDNIDENTDIEIISHSQRELMENNGIELIAGSEDCLCPLHTYKVRFGHFVDLYIHKSSYYINPYMEIWAELIHDKSMIVFKELFSPESIIKRMQHYNNSTEEEINNYVEWTMERYKRLKEDILSKNRDEPFYPYPIFLSKEAKDLIYSV